MALCAVTVDLDEIPHYYAIHGLPEPEGPARTLVYDVAVGRLERLARDLELPLTLFAVGSDLSRAESAGRLRDAHRAGAEIGNHSLDHRYDLTRLGRAEIRRQVGDGADAIERAVGTRPAGFRAPGYTVTDEVFEVLAELGVEYDSSVFPCPPYWTAKAAALSLMALRGRSSRSILDRPTVLAAPTTPYRVGRPYWRRGKGPLELPVTVAPWTRLPALGTYLTLFGSGVARRLARACAGLPLVNLELHGIDVLDAADGLEDLRPHQVDVRVAREDKLRALRATIDELRNAGYSFVTLGEAAKSFATAA